MIKFPVEPVMSRTLSTCSLPCVGLTWRLDLEQSQEI